MIIPRKENQSIIIYDYVQNLLFVSHYQYSRVNYLSVQSARLRFHLSNLEQQVIISPWNL